MLEFIVLWIMTTDAAVSFWRRPEKGVDRQAWCISLLLLKDLHIMLLGFQTLWSAHTSTLTSGEPHGQHQRSHRAAAKVSVEEKSKKPQKRKYTHSDTHTHTHTHTHTQACAVKQHVVKTHKGGLEVALGARLLVALAAAAVRVTVATLAGLVLARGTSTGRAGGTSGHLVRLGDDIGGQVEEPARNREKGGEKKHKQV
jgi:hypothetical protein